MEKNIISRNLVIAVGAAIAAAAIIIAGGLVVERRESVSLQNSLIENMTTTISSADGAAGGSPSQAGTAGSPSSQSGPAAGGGAIVQPLPPFKITIMTPASGDSWQIGQSNSISWDRAADITGEIDLIDAATGQFVGVITSNTGPQQTSYSWDTRQVYLERYGALKKDIVPGSYFVQLKFDGNNLPNIASGAVKID